MMETGRQQILAHVLANIEHFVGAEPGAVMRQAREYERTIGVCTKVTQKGRPRLQAAAKQEA